jgi:hypothetical protein
VDASTIWRFVTFLFFIFFICNVIYVHAYISKVLN